MEDAIWAMIGEYVPALSGLLVAVCVILSIFFALIDGIRVDRWKLFSNTMLKHFVKDPYE